MAALLVHTNTLNEIFDEKHIYVYTHNIVRTQTQEEATDDAKKNNKMPLITFAL